MSGRASEASFQTVDDTVRLLVRPSLRGDGFELMLSESGLNWFPFSYEEGRRLLGAISQVAHLCHPSHSDFRLSAVSKADPRFSVEATGGGLTFYFVLKGDRAIDMGFFLDRSVAAELFSHIESLLEEQVVRGVMES